MQHNIHKPKCPFYVLSKHKEQTGRLENDWKPKQQVHQINQTSPINQSMQCCGFSGPDQLELYLFDVEEVPGIKRDGSARHRYVFIERATVADIRLHREGHCFSLGDRAEWEMCCCTSNITFWPNE